MCQKRCFFIGHRDAPATVLSALRKAIETQIVAYGVTDFLVGNYGNFDRLTAHALLEAKKKNPHITLSLLLPYHPSESSVECPEGFDNTYYPPGMETVPRRLAIVRANQYVIDHVNSLIAYVRHPASNARKLLEYAQKRERQGSLKIFMLEEP